MEPIVIKDLYDFHFLSGLQIGPDGKTAVFVEKTAIEEDNGYRSVLHMVRDNAIRPLTDFGKEGLFTWKDERTLYLFTVRSDKDKKRVEAGEVLTPVYQLPVDGGEAIRCGELYVNPFQVEKIEEDCYWMLATIRRDCPDFYSMDEENRRKVEKQVAEDKDYEVADETPFWFNGRGFTSYLRTALFIWKPSTNELKRVSAPAMDVADVVVLGDDLIYCGSQWTTKPLYKSDVYAYNWKAGTHRTLREDHRFDISALTTFNGRLVAAMSDQEAYGLNQAPCLYWMDPQDGKETLLSESFSLGNSTGSDCRLGGGRAIKGGKKGIYFVQTLRNASILCKCDEEGTISTLLGGEGSVDDFDVCEETDCALVVRMTATTLQEVYGASLSEHDFTKLTCFHDDYLKTHYVAAPKKLVVPSCNDVIDGWVLLPENYDQSKKYPAILDIHGGPKTVYGEVFYHEMQVWASKGYVVFFCNPMGSDGRGDEFADIRGKYGTNDYQNIMDFTDAVLEAYPEIDVHRVCVTGGSYGGFMTNWIVGHTNRFVCGATQRSISNWISFQGVSDIGEWFGSDQQAASFQTDLDKLWWHSPLRYVGQAETPLLFIHSDEDYRCPLEQGVQFYSALTSKGVPTRMVIFHGENHELSRGGKPKHRQRRLQEITDWFDHYTK